MSISVIPYLDESAAAIFAAKLNSSTQVNEPDTSSDFAAILNENTAALAVENTTEAFQTAGVTTDIANTVPVSETTAGTGTSGSYTTSDLEAIFEEAANTFGVSKDLLKSIAKTESNFNPSATSKAGAMGIMQLMPATAQALGVSNPYDARENIIAGASMISSLLTKYNGNTSLALAAYNAGSGNVDKYGGIPPFAETQNYVQKVLAGIGEEIQIPSTASSLFDLTGDARNEANRMLDEFFSSHNITKDSLDLIVTLMKLKQMGQSSDAE